MEMEKRTENYIDQAFLDIYFSLYTHILQSEASDKQGVKAPALPEAKFMNVQFR
jgi:hypothetical protein